MLCSNRRFSFHRFLLVFFLFSVEFQQTFAEENQRSPWNIEWVRGDGAEECATGEQLSALVSVHVGIPQGEPQERSVLIRGSIERNESSGRFEIFFVVIDSQGGVRGYRELAVEELDCRNLDEGVSLMIALAVENHFEQQHSQQQQSADQNEADDDQRDETPQTQQTPVEQPEPPYRQDVLVPAPEPTGSRSVRGLLGPLFEYGGMPGPVAGIDFHFVFQFPSVFSFALDVAAIPRSTQYVFERELSYSFYAISPGFCPTFSRSGRLLFEICGMAEFAWINSQGVSFDENYRFQRFLFNVLFIFRFQLIIRNFLLVGVGAGASVFVIRHHYSVVDRQGERHLIHEPMPVSLRASVTLGFRFP